MIKATTVESGANFKTCNEMNDEVEGETRLEELKEGECMGHEIKSKI